MRGIIIAIRNLFVLLLVIAWPLLKHIAPLKLAFAVYGTDSDQRTYWPGFIHAFLRRFRPAIPIGLFKSPSGLGVVMASTTSDGEFRDNPQLALDYLRHLRNELPYAVAIALAGRLPGWVAKAHSTIVPPFVDGTTGTRFAMVRVAEQLAEETSRPAEQLAIALPGGGGYLGSRLADDLAPLFRCVIAIDTAYEERAESGNVVRTPNHAEIASADVVLVITAKGDQFQPFISHLPDNHPVIIGDDTHPCMKAPVRQQVTNHLQTRLFKVAMIGHMYMLPRLPNFNPRDVPGCLVEAIIVAQYGYGILADISAFRKIAEGMGFAPRLYKHRGDS